MLFEKIKKLCAEKGISIYRLEKDLGFSGSSICKWERSNPSANKLKKVANYLDISIEELLKEK